MTANFLKYMRFIIRRERVTGLIWIISMTSAAFGLAMLYPGLFPTKEALQSVTATMNTPAMIAIMGPVYGFDKISPAIAMAHECLVIFAIAAIVMNIFFVSRHTRVDEELGRHEMLASLPVGRLTGSAATIVAAFILNIIISLFSALSILALNIEGTTTAGAFAYAFSFGMQGFLFAAITLLAAQLFSTAHGCTGVSFALMGLFYLLRASGDMSGNALSFISPMGLGLKVEAFYTDAFWPILVIFIEAVIISAAALLINIKRDVGAGIFPARKGRQYASRFLQSPLGLAWRLSRNSFIVWSISFFAIGASYGAVVGELDSFVEGNDVIKQMLESQGGSESLVEAFLPMVFGIMSLILSVPVINTATRSYSEEKRGRTEQIYSRAVNRTTMFGSFAVIALAESILFPAVTALGLCAAAQSTGLVDLGVTMKAAFIYLPAILVMAAFAILLVGIAPKLISLIWVLFAYSFLMVYFGRIFDVPEFVIRISPFNNIPQYPIQEFSAVPIIVLCIIAVALGVAGFMGYRRRDIMG